MVFVKMKDNKQETKTQFLQHAANIFLWGKSKHSLAKLKDYIFTETC